jgi:hypothetical protein
MAKSAAADAAMPLGETTFVTLASPGVYPRGITSVAASKASSIANRSGGASVPLASHEGHASCLPRTARTGWHGQVRRGGRRHVIGQSNLHDPGGAGTPDNPKYP